MSVLPKKFQDSNYVKQKKLLVSQIGIPSQMVKADKLFTTCNDKRDPEGRKLKSISEKILIQMAAKGGATPWAVKNMVIDGNESMVVGFDTYHDTANKGTSYGAMVSSFNNLFTR